MKKLLAMMLMLATVFFIACDEDDEETVKKITGKWYLYQEIDVEIEGGFTYTDKMTYNPDFDIDFYGAELYEITSESITYYGSDPESTSGYYMESVSYEIDGKKIITSFVDETEIIHDTATYYFEGDMLVIETSYEEPGYTNNTTIKFKPYKGNIPTEIWSTGLTNDSYEPDDTYQTSSAIVLNSPQKHVTIYNDQDWFQFEAFAGETYLIQIHGYMDNYLYLYDTDGQTLLTDDDDNDQDLDVETSYWGNPVLLWTCQTSGSYYFNVKGYDSNDQGVYVVEITTTDLSIGKATKQADKKIERLPFFGK